jgi:hypothetical protein
MADQQLQSQKDPSLYRLPPQSIEAEESLLSAILVDNKLPIFIGPPIKKYLPPSWTCSIGVNPLIW